MPPSPLSPRTLTDHEFKVRQFASALVRSGVKIELLAHLKDVLDPERLQTGFRFFLNRSKGQVTTQIIGIACALASVAQWGSGMSAEELDAVIKVLNKVRRDETGRSRGRRAGMTPKNKALLRQFDDPANVAKIVYAPDILCEGLPLQGPLTVRQAEAVRTALMAEILLVFPIREANLAPLRLGQHIQWSQPGRRGVVSIYIQYAEVKNDQDLEVQLPPRTARLLEYYLKHALPLLGDPTAPWLFPGQKGHLHPRAMGEQFRRVMKRIGAAPKSALHPTPVRQTLSGQKPGQFAIIQYALGHKNETTMKFYAEFSSVAALKLVDDSLLGLRAGHKPTWHPFADADAEAEPSAWARRRLRRQIDLAGDEWPAVDRQAWRPRAKGDIFGANRPSRQLVRPLREVPTNTVDGWLGPARKPGH
jgi:hypothetical protein